MYLCILEKTYCHIVKMKILVVLSRFPYPLEKGDKLRAYHQIRCLSEKHDIVLVALHDREVSEEAVEQLRPYCSKMYLLRQGKVRSALNVFFAFFKGLPIQCGYFYSAKNRREIERIVNDERPDRIYCQLIRMAEYVKDLAIKKVLDYQDVFSKGMWRRYENANFLAKPFFKMESRRVARYESDVFDKFDACTIITEVDRDLIPHPRRDEIVIVHNGVQFEQFQYRGENKSCDLIFSGNMGYAPNVDAAEYLAKEIFPPLRAQFPGLKLVLCGASPAPRVQALRADGVTVTGWVDSMRDWYAMARVFVAPMRMGTGLQNKLLEAMSMQLPCVTSPLAGKPLENAEAAGAVVTCCTTEEYIETIARLLQDADYYRQLSERGNRYVHGKYDWKAATDRLEQLFH